MATATNRIHSNDLKACGKKCCCLWSLSEVKFLMHFCRLFELSHFGTFSCSFYVLLCGKLLNLHQCCAVYMFISETMFILIKVLSALRTFRDQEPKAPMPHCDHALSDKLTALDCINSYVFSLAFFVFLTYFAYFLMVLWCQI